MIGSSRAKRRWPFRGLLVAAVAAGLSLASSLPGHDSASGPSVTYAAAGCNLVSPSGSVKHVIYIQFDNVHFFRDNPNVPSDLEQMPHLMSFITNNGTLLSNHHTPLISHTATDILTSLTGLYGDRMGVPVANSYRYFKPDGTSNTGVSFAYWTDPIYDPATSTPTDTAYNMLTETGKNTPAPWVPFTRAGCNVGSVATANTVLENTSTDIPTVFGAGSAQAAEVSQNSAQAFADFVGIGIHCAQTSTLCSAANGGEPDRLPDEPGGYSGYMGLFGHRYVAPQIDNVGAGDSGTTLHDLNGNVISDRNGHIGFPGFDGMPAAVSLAYVADMQEVGVPVTYAYISDAHDAHPNGPAYGPGQAGYVAALHAYDGAFGSFFDRLQADGINRSNTLFVFTSDEGDHFVGGPPTPAGCDGTTTPCTYSQIGELTTNLSGLLATQSGITTPFKVHSDSAPTVYVNGQPGPTDPMTRSLERASAWLTVTNPLTNSKQYLANYLADPTEMGVLHMVTADPARTPTFTLFAKPDYFVTTGATNCSTPCVSENPAFAWNHGDVAPEITTTWLGMVGPGVQNRGIDSSTWSDHADIRPTILSLIGLQDDYVHDGRVITEIDSNLPKAARARLPTLERLGAVYKQLNAPNGILGLGTLSVATSALSSGSATDDTAYTYLEGWLSSIAAQRNALVPQMRAMLEGAEFSGQNLNEQQAQGLIRQGNALLATVRSMAAAY